MGRSGSPVGLRAISPVRKARSASRRIFAGRRDAEEGGMVVCAGTPTRRGRIGQSRCIEQPVALECADAWAA